MGYYRGHNPGDTRRIKTGRDSWDQHLFVSSDPDSARMYGRQLTKYTARPNTRILREGSREWVRVAGKPRQKETLLDYADRAATAAKQAGYHAAHFTRQGDIGTAIFDPSQFDSEPVDEKLPKARGGSVNHSPTEAQKAAGNYAKAHISFQGLPISIENRAGSTRRGVGADGKPWSCTFPADYGYIKRTEGADGDHVDVYVGPDRHSNLVVVVNQHELGAGQRSRGTFDEHKILLGFKSETDALDCYVKAFSDGKGADRIGSVEVMSLDGFKKWLKGGKTTKPLKPRTIVDHALKLVSAEGAAR